MRFLCAFLITALILKVWPATIRAQDGILIENVRPTFPREGEPCRLTGRVEVASNKPSLFVEDPVSGLCAEVQIDPDGSFSYTTQPALQAGLYGIVFRLANTDTQIDPEIYVISIAPDFSIGAEQYYYYVDDQEISLGSQGSNLDNEINSLIKRVDGGVLDRISWLDGADVLKDVLNSASHLGINIIEDISTSPTTLVALAVTGTTCVASGGLVCAIMIPITVEAVAKSAIEESVEMVVYNSPELEPDTRELILEATRLTLMASDVYTIFSGANDLGEFKTVDESVLFWSSVLSLAEEDIVASSVEDFEIDDDGAVSSLTLQVILESGDCYMQKLVASKSIETEDNTYLDTKIVFDDGDEMLCTAVHGDFGGRQIGAVLKNQASFLTVIDSEGHQHQIPKNIVSDVQEESLKILEVDRTLGLQVRVNRGFRHQIKAGASYRVYRPTRNLILGNSEIVWIGAITILNVLEDSSIAMIARVNRGVWFKRGDYCKQ